MKEEAVNNSLYWSIMGVVFGIIGIVAGFLFPAGGFIFSLIGLIIGITQRKKMTHGWAKKAIFLSIIGLIVSVVLWIISAYLIKLALQSGELNPELLSQLGAK